MLSSKKIVSLKNDWPRLTKSGRWYDFPTFRILLAKNLGETKFAFIVSKKVSLSSVLRHKAKRQLATAVSKLVFVSGWDVVILAKKSILGLPQKVVDEQTAQALKGINILQ